MDHSQPPVLSQLTGHLLTVTINRPHVHNAVNFEVMNELERTVAQAERNEDIRVLILQGAGDKFISGGDLKSFHTITSERESEIMAKKMLGILTRLEKLPCWTIASINGDCYGGGCEIALALDFRVSYPGVTIGFTQSHFYLPPGWGGLTRLIDQTGRSKALEWLAGGECINGEEALRTHFLNRLTEQKSLSNYCKKWGKQLAKNDRAFIANLKNQALNYSEKRKNRLENETSAFTRFWVDEEHLNRVNDFLARKERKN